jgi:eukaryotic-like serine/threonine-protein kinase
VIGETVGSYRIVGKLGEGGMGAVYVAHHALLGRKAAIKVLLPALSRQPEVVERFFNEARAVTSMSDPGIVQIFDFGYHTDGSAFIVMELLEGEPLDRRLARRGRLPVVEALRIGRQVAISLATAHSRGIVHRDLKPENVFLVRDSEVAHGERAKLLDFGIAKLSGEGNISKTGTGALLGTPTYMSPEQCRGAGEVDHRSDIYALGCLLFHLLTGAPPFLGEGIGDVIAAHLREPAPSPASRVAGVPAALDALVRRCLAKAAGDRPASMSELAGAIDQLLVAQANADQVTYLMPGAGVTPFPAVRAGASAPGAGDATGPSPYPLAPLPFSTGAPPAAGSHPGTVALHLPTTLGSAASQQLPKTGPGNSSASASHRTLRWVASATFLGVAAAVAFFLAVQRQEESGRGQGGGATVRAAAQPSPPAAPASTASSGERTEALAPAPVAPAPVAAAPVAAPPPATPAAPAAATAEPEPPKQRRSRSRKKPARDGCDRSIDPDCDGIPDVR